jgi:hypothetical protein
VDEVTSGLEDTAASATSEAGGNAEASMQADATLAVPVEVELSAPPLPASADAPCFDLFRLRNYNSFTQLKTDAFEDETPPPALEPIPLSDCPPAVYADYNAELNAALDAAASDQGSMQGSVQSNAGVADDDELQMYDDDIGAFEQDDINKASDGGFDSGDFSLMIVGTAAKRHVATSAKEDEVSSYESFDAVAAKIAQNSDLVAAECSLKLPGPGQDSRGSPVAATAVCAIPIVDVPYDSDIPELVSITPPPEPSAPPFESTPIIPSDFGEKMVCAFTALTSCSSTQRLTDSLCAPRR